MDTSKFNQKAGIISVTTDLINNKNEEYSYFYPKEFPKELELDNEIIKKLSQANLYLGELRGLTNTVSNINLFIQAYKRREAVLSSKIEGTIVSLTDVFLSEAGDTGKKDYLDLREVKNYVYSLNFALDKLSKGERLNKDMLNYMHYLLLQKVRGAERVVGKYRQKQNWIGRDMDIQKADFVPPPAKFVPDLMERMFLFMNNESQLPDLIKIGLMHYYFETIHPYEDGNGRLGRTLIILYLNQNNILKEPILYLSPFLEKNKDIYYDYLMKIRREGDYISWLKFFLDGINQVSVDTSARIKRMLLLYETYKEKLKQIRATSISYELLDKFFENPYSRIPILEANLHKKYPKINYPLIKRGMDNLKKVGVIEEITHRKRNKFYVAPEILGVLERD